ncbi:MAG: 2-C-methyl-D-erythritol 4-phosphate cytidylyltransferase, partial [Burkholderiaceae bacterium]|nr:2-C-methyl-D-erythritol 4-phosphate cytidylyltransferase [Burkholderiaceae bacterium]
MNALLPPPLPFSLPLSSLAPLSAPERFWALVPCAGVGLRAVAGPAPAVVPGSDVPLPKQYHLIAGQPMVLHTLGAFAGVSRLLGTLVAVAPGDHFLDAYAHPAFFVVECGGPTRAQSVLGGLRALQERGAQATDWVLVHDAARCLVTSAQIDGLMDVCAGDAVGGLLAHKLADTLKTST